jgi:ABC-2 type transport system ATP-binding protein
MKKTAEREKRTRRAHLEPGGSSGQSLFEDTVLEVQHIQKLYGSVQAVKDVSFEVYRGEIFGMVGPNGAGKTTTIECIEGLREPDRGDVSLLGLQPWGQRRELATRIGVQLQECSLPARLSVWESMQLFASFYTAVEEPETLLKEFGLWEKRRQSFGKLSGGQKQRLFIALALLHRPEVVFFDELTTGLDPQARRSMWQLVQKIREAGCTVFLTTHSMEEAERLCDRVAIIDHGEIVALDTPQALIRALGVQKRLVFSLEQAAQELPLNQLTCVDRVERVGERVVVYGHGDRFAGPVVTRLEQAGVAFYDLRTEQASLEDVFLALTGREIRE